MKKAGKIIRGISLALAVFLLLGTVPSIAQAPGEIKVPEGAVKLPDIMPVSWERWGLVADQPLGPAYLVHQGKVIGLEYMFNPSTLDRQNPMPPPIGGVNYEHSKTLSVNTRVNFIGVGYIYPGCPVFPQAHYIAHLMFRPPEEIYKLANMGTPPPSISPKPDTAGLVKISEIVPFMGEHHANPGNLPFGPIGLLSQNKLIGWEFMFQHDKFKGGPMKMAGQDVWFYLLGPITVGADVNHVTFTYLPRGHEGYEVWHYDIHLYNITPEERMRIVPPGFPVPGGPPGSASRPPGA